jgi:hypothetical protein
MNFLPAIDKRMEQFAHIVSLIGIGEENATSFDTIYETLKKENAKTCQPCLLIFIDDMIRENKTKIQRRIVNEKLLYWRSYE